VLSSVVSVLFYLRIVVMMYMADERAAGHRPPPAKVAVAGMLLALVAVFYLGLMPGQLLSIAKESVATFFP
jgi:NADH-quinone oxidoreductase subunit N